MTQYCSLIYPSLDDVFMDSIRKYQNTYMTGKQVEKTCEGKSIRCTIHIKGTAMSDTLSYIMVSKLMVQVESYYGEILMGNLYKCLKHRTGSTLQAWFTVLTDDHLHLTVLIWSQRGPLSHPGVYSALKQAGMVDHQSSVHCCKVCPHILLLFCWKKKDRFNLGSNFLTISTQIN